MLCETSAHLWINNSVATILSYLTFKVKLIFILFPCYSRSLVPSRSSELPSITLYIIYKAKSFLSANYIYSESAYFLTLTFNPRFMIAFLPTQKLYQHYQTTSSADVLSSSNHIPACCVAQPSF